MPPHPPHPNCPPTTAAITASHPNRSGRVQAALREYVLADSGAQNQAEPTVRLVITHSNLQAKFMDIRLDKHVSGAPPAHPSPPSLPSMWPKLRCVARGV